MKSQFHICPLNNQGFSDPHQLKPYCLDRFSFAFLLEGDILAEVEGNNILLCPGQFILVPERQAITIKHFNNCQGFQGSFSLSFLKDASFPVLHGSKPVLQSFWFDDAVFIGALLKRMCSAYEDKDRVFLQSGLDLLLGQLHGSTNVAQIPDRFLQMVFQQDQSPLTVSAYAALLHVTPNYLNKTVKSHTHRTAIDWIEIARLNLAKQYLRDRTFSIAQIAEKTGLVDQSYFSRFFKKKTGLSPSEYRNSL